MVSVHLLNITHKQTNTERLSMFTL